MPSSLLVRAIAAAALALAGGSAGAQAPQGGALPAVTIDRVFPNLAFAKPVGAVQAPGHDDRWFVIEREGRVMTFAADDATAATPFLDLRDAITTAGEEEAGLLGLAFHPQFATNRRFYVFYSGAPDSGYRIQSRLAAFTATDLTHADRSSEKVLIKANKAESNHNGGQLAFGPDGYLYASLGDGGGGDDPFDNGQSTRTLFGKIIRIDVDRGSPYAIPADNPFAGNALCARVASGFGTADTFRSRSECPEIYAWGLRNAWRFSFDRGSAAPDLWAGDVGQGAYEEIDRIRTPAGNYGWDVKEGPGCHEPSTDCAGGELIDPVAAAPRATGLASIIGGFVYRGAALPALAGRYLFTDFFTRGLYLHDATAPNGYSTLLGNVGIMASSFAQDASGELYLVAYDSGGLYKIAPARGPGN
jgi:glucose/arabinose dehydrogenase